MNIQQIVAANVAARGYKVGWETDQFIARQFAKMTEELHEAIEYVHPVANSESVWRWIDHLKDAGNAARRAFDEKTWWRTAYIIDHDKVRAELTDVLVVLLTTAEALDFDVLQAAIDKSAADIERGVR